MPEPPSWLGRWITGALAVGRARGRRAGIELAALLVLVLAIGLVDRASGYQIRFGVFYLVPVSVATVRCGTRPALGLSVASALIGAGPAGPAGTPWTTDLLNLGFRFTMLAFVVGMLSLLVRAMEEARSSDRRSREFLRYAAHQLRTPTTSVSTTAQGLLAGGGVHDEAALVRLVSESDRMGRIVAAMLRFLRLEQGDGVGHATEDLRGIATHEVERWNDVAAPVRLHLGVPADPGDVPVPADAVREVLGILFDNAVRHARAVVSVDIETSGERAEVRVRDDGPGLPEGQEERAFLPFVSLDGHGGTGLGLAIGRRLAEVVGGSLALEAGAFVLTVPVARGLADAPRSL